MPVSLVSRLILAGVCSAAAAGWVGVRVDGPGDGPTVQAAAIERPAEAAAAPPPPGVRNRASWQPSPVPAPPIGASQNPAQPGPNGAAAGAAAVPSLPGAGAAARAPAGPTPRPLPGPPAAGGDAYLPYSQLFTADRLEAPFAGGLPAARGEWREAHFFSRALHREEAYLVWLPPGYGDGRATYPTLYLLHGVGGPEGGGVGEWLGYALAEDLDRLLALGLIEPMLVVLPAGEQGYWMNHAAGGPRWADFVARDLVAHVDATFRIDPRRERRAVGGLSMGGHGALQLALNFPDVFGIAGAHSPTLRPFADSPAFFGDPAWFARYDPLSLIQRTAAARRIAFWIDVGADDAWRAGAAAVAQALAAKRAPVTYTVLEGEHEGWYWAAYLPEYLHFYSQAFGTGATTPQGAPAVAVQPLGPLLTGTGMAAAAAAPTLS